MMKKPRDKLRLPGHSLLLLGGIAIIFWQSSEPWLLSMIWFVAHLALDKAELAIWGIRDRDRYRAEWRRRHPEYVGPQELPLYPNDADAGHWRF